MINNLQSKPGLAMIRAGSIFSEYISVPVFSLMGGSRLIKPLLISGYMGGSGAA
jgi:hypothetical protein